MNSPRRPMTAANGYSLLEPADCARAMQRRIIAISDDSESCLVMALTFAARRTVKLTSGFAPSQIIMTGHGIRHIDNVPLTAQRLEKLSVVGRPSCASTTELDTIMIMAKAASFVCGFTPAPSIHY